MYDGEQQRARLRQEVKNQIFEKQFQAAVDYHIEKKKEDSEKLYSEKVNRYDYTLMPRHKRHRKFEVVGDDKVKHGKWTNLMQDCAFYFDRPTIDQERKMRATL